ncbi:DUF6503 family protein [uncultured Muriicola sp.]|uniref:DUF6503 family protein n=1 Tax=uncultured Muriicola sp. TaxID=1583102 RepID=UPI002622B9A3|nr:DUF6503 family protein [uncultured Muriicola sp.]
MLKNYSFVLLLIFVLSCNDNTEVDDVQKIIDASIEVAGGDLYKTSNISFRFRDRDYVLEQLKGKRALKRIQYTDSGMVTDIKQGNSFKRFINEEPIPVTDSMATVYGNSVNSVHYFALLPYGLNDRAVRKELLGKKQIKGKDYYKVKVTFDQQGGGNDFEDVYLYWIDQKTYKPTYLAYEFHVDGGGLRFRKAYNERYVNGIRFVDYYNYKPMGEIVITQIDSLYEKEELVLLSKIELKNVEVNQGNYN